MFAQLDTDKSADMKMYSFNMESMDPSVAQRYLQGLIPAPSSASDNLTTTSSSIFNRVATGSQGTMGLNTPRAGDSGGTSGSSGYATGARAGTAAFASDQETRSVFAYTDPQTAGYISNVTARLLRQPSQGPTNLPAFVAGKVASTTSTSATGGGVEKLNFQNAPLQQVLSSLADAAGMTINSKVPLNGRVTLVTPGPMTRQDAAKQLNAALAENGYGAFLQDDLTLKIDTADNIKRLYGQIGRATDPKEILNKDETIKPADMTIRTPPTNAPIPQPEVQTHDNAFSTFSLNVSDVSFKLAAASLEKGQLPDAASVRSEEFINAFDYRDPEPPAGLPIAFAWERARYPFAHNRDLLRFSVKTAALGRQPGRPLNLVLLLDNSGSMERADRVRIIHEALRVLATQLQAQDTLSVVTFARTARLWVDGVPGTQAGAVFEQVGGLTPQGGTNLEEAMRLAYETALRHYLAGGINRVVLLTDGAANLGDVDPDALKQKVEAHRKQGVALDCFGIGWEGYNDDLLEMLTRNGDGRYGFINTPEEAATEFAGQLAGALHVAASDVKVQVEFNPRRVTAYRQIGYAKLQLTKEQFRDNTVDAGEIGAAESGNALYAVEVNPGGAGPLGTVRVRFRIPGTSDYREQAWAVPYAGNAVALEQGSPAMRLAATASAFSEWLAASPFAGEVTTDRLLGYLSGVPEIYGADARPKKLEWMIRQAKAIAGK